MISVFMIDTIGEHRGMHYYNFPLVDELNQLGIKVTLVTTIETVNHILRPKTLTVLPGFKGIYGQAPKSIRGLRYGFSLLKIIYWIMRDTPHIIHFHFPQIPIFDYFFFKILVKKSINYIITVHDVMPFEYGSDVTVARHSMLHRIYQNASGLILNSTHAMQKLAELDQKLLKKTHLIYPGAYTHFPTLELTSIEAKRNLGLEENTIILLVFGTIKQNKRLDLVIEAISQIVDKWPNIRLLIVGQPQNRDLSSEISLVHSLDISKNVIWNLKKVNDEEMKMLFSAANVVIFPYQWIYQSAAVLMAMSLGKAVVATAVGSNQDTIINGKTGLLVSTTDARETAVAIQTLLSNPKFANQLAKAAKKEVTKRFSWKTNAKKTRHFYQQLLHLTKSPLLR